MKSRLSTRRLVIAGMLLLADTPWAASVEIELVGSLRRDTGQFIVRICDSAQCWRAEVADDENCADGTRGASTPRIEIYPAKQRRLIVTDLKVDRSYSFEVHHDEDGDGCLDMTTIVGHPAPAEGFGFSRNVYFGAGGKKAWRDQWKNVRVRVGRMLEPLRINIVHMCPALPLRALGNLIGFEQRIVCSADELSKGGKR